MSEDEKKETTQAASAGSGVPEPAAAAPSAPSAPEDPEAPEAPAAADAAPEAPAGASEPAGVALAPESFGKEQPVRSLFGDAIGAGAAEGAGQPAAGAPSEAASAAPDETQTFNPLADDPYAQAAAAEAAAEQSPAQPAPASEPAPGAAQLTPAEPTPAQPASAEPAPARSVASRPAGTPAEPDDVSAAPVDATSVAPAADAAPAEPPADSAEGAEPLHALQGAGHQNDDWAAVMAEGPDAGEDDDLGDGTRGRRVAIWTIAIALIIVFLGGGVLYMHFHYADRVAPGVSLGSVDMGGKTADEARADIQTVTGQSTITTSLSDSQTIVATLDDLGVSVNLDQTVDNLIAAKPSDSFLGFFERINPFSKVSVPVVADTDEAVMTQFLSDNLIVESDRMENATVSYDQDSAAFVSTESKDGRAVNLNPVKEAVDKVLADPGSAQEAESSIVDGTAAISTAAAQSARDIANRRLENPIVLRTDGGTSLTVPVSTVASWIRLTSDLNAHQINMSYDEDAIKGYVSNSIAEQLNQDAQDATVIVSDDGTTLGTLASGRTGVQINPSDDVATQIVDILDAGKGGSVTVDSTTVDFATVKQTRHLNQENGDMWINVDLAQQKATVANGSTMVREINISTGTLATPTKTGTFLVWSRKDSGAVYGENTGVNVPQWVTYYNDQTSFIGADWDQENIDTGTPSTQGNIFMSSADAQWIHDNAQDSTIVVITGETPAEPVRPPEEPEEPEEPGENPDNPSPSPSESASPAPSPSASPSESASPTDTPSAATGTE